MSIFANPDGTYGTTSQPGAMYGTPDYAASAEYEITHGIQSIIGGTSGGYSNSSAPPAIFGAAAVPMLPSNVWNDPGQFLLPDLDALVSKIPGLGAFSDKVGSTVGGPTKAVAGAADEVVNIFTDVPRLITIVVGLILLLAGLFLLGSKPAIQLVGSVQKTAGAIGALAA